MKDNEKLPDPVLAELGEVYELGVVHQITHLPQGRVNDNYDLKTNTGRYVVRRSRDRRTVDAIAFEHSLMEYLHQHDFPVPPLLYTRAGVSFHVVDGLVYRVTSFIEGEKYDAERPAHLKAVAQSLARYHQIIQDYDSQGAKEGFRPVLASLADGLTHLPWPSTHPIIEISPGMNACLAHLHQWLVATHNRLAEQRRQPRLVIHGSCRSGSFIFHDDRVAAMLDYDIAYPDVRTLDIAIALLDFAMIRPEKRQVDLDLAHDFVVAYQGIMPLISKELALVPWYMRARILKRELVRYEHYLSRPKEKREAKLQRAADRLTWLADHEGQLLDALGVPSGVL